MYVYITRNGDFSGLDYIICEYEGGKTVSFRIRHYRNRIECLYFDTYILAEAGNYLCLNCV